MDGSIGVEWGEPVQFNGTPIWFSNHGQHAWWGGGWKVRVNMSNCQLISVVWIIMMTEHKLWSLWVKLKASILQYIRITGAVRGSRKFI